MPLINPHIQVIMPAVPVFILQLFFQPIEIFCQNIFLIEMDKITAKISFQFPLHAGGQAVGYHIINFIVYFFKIPNAFLHFFFCGQFLFPPGDSFDAIGQASFVCGDPFFGIVGIVRIKDSALNVVAGGPAKDEKFLAFYLKHLPPFQINDLIAKDMTNPPSVPFFQMVVLQHIIIFVVSGYPENLKGQS